MIRVRARWISRRTLLPSCWEVWNKSTCSTFRMAIWSVRRYIELHNYYLFQLIKALWSIYMPRSSWFFILIAMIDPILYISGEVFCHVRVCTLYTSVQCNLHCIKHTICSDDWCFHRGFHSLRVETIERWRWTKLDSLIGDVGVELYNSGHAERLNNNNNNNTIGGEGVRYFELQCLQRSHNYFTPRI